MIFAEKADGVYFYRDRKWLKMPDALAKSARLMSRKQLRRLLKKVDDAN